MIKTTKPTVFDLAPPRDLIDKAHYEANRDALLEHARMGRSVCQSDGNGGVIWIEPKEIFARYGLDEFGRPKAE